MFALVCPSHTLPPLCPSTSHALPIFIPSHSSCPPIPHSPPIRMPSHSPCPPTAPALSLLLPSLSLCPPNSPALPTLLPSHSSCPPTPIYFGLLCPPYLGGHGRAKGVGGQEDWEGRRSGRVGGVGGQEGRTNTGQRFSFFHVQDFFRKRMAEFQ